MIQPERQVSRIEGIVATQFDECSLAAAAACRDVKVVLGDKSKTTIKMLEVLDTPYGLPGSLRAVNVADIGQRYLLEAGSVPRLLRLVCEDIAMPIASFAERSGERCSYVQLGPEMLDENIVIGAKDERRIVIEGIRRVIAEQNDAGLLPFVWNSTQENMAEIELREPAALARAVRRQFEQSDKQKTDLFIVDGAGDPDIKQRYKIVSVTMPMIRPYRLAPEQADDCRRMHMVLGEKDKSGVIEILLVLRDDVAVQIASITKDNNWHSILPNSDLKTWRTIHGAVHAELSRYEEYYKRRRVQKKISKTIESFSSDTDLLQIHETRRGVVHNLIKDNIIIGKVNENYRGDGHTVYTCIATGNSVPSKGIISMYRDLAIGPQLDTLLGPTSQQVENVLNALGALTRKKDSIVHNGILKNRTINGSVIDIEVSLRVHKICNGASYRISIVGRPSGQTSVAKLSFYDGEISRTKPNTFTIADFEEIESVLQAVVK